MLTYRGVAISRTHFSSDGTTTLCRAENNKQRVTDILTTNDLKTVTCEVCGRMEIERKIHTDSGEPNAERV